MNFIVGGRQFERFRKGSSQLPIVDRESCPMQGAHKPFAIGVTRRDTLCRFFNDKVAYQTPVIFRLRIVAQIAK